MNKAKITVVFLSVLLWQCCGDGRFDCAAVLSGINTCLEAGNTEAAKELLTDELLCAVTNESSRVEVAHSTGDWVKKYGEDFPESILLYCLAGGEMDIVREAYGGLDSLVSKNCARWCLMVREEPLDEVIKVHQGKYYSNRGFYTSMGSVIVEGEKGGQRINKVYSIKKKGFRSYSSVKVSDAVAVVRSDNVPVPWGIRMNPSIDYLPFDLDRNMLNWCPGWGGAPSFNVKRYYAGMQNSMVGIRREKLKSDGANVVWDFFIATLPSVLCVGGQPVALEKKDTVIEGRLHSIVRILVSKEKELSDFYADDLLYQDVLISPPIDYRVECSGIHPSIQFSIEGKVTVIPDGRKGGSEKGKGERGHVLIGESRHRFAKGETNHFLKH